MLRGIILRVLHVWFGFTNLRGGFFYGYFELKRRFFMKCYYCRFYYEILLIINFDFFYFILV